MSKRSDLTMEAIKGFQAPQNGNPFIATSPSWFAFKLGEYFQRTGRTLPRDVRMGRGYQIHANDMLFAFDASNAITPVE